VKQRRTEIGKSDDEAKKAVLTEHHDRHEQIISARFSSYWRNVLLGLIIVVTVAIVYKPAWHGGFIWDDDVYVSKNKLLTQANGLARIWFSLDSPSQYFPLTYTSFWIERRIWGLNTTGYHIINILFHATNALLIWRLLTSLKLPGSWLAAGLFALHPVNVESVAWISERKNVLSLFFSLISLLAWAAFTKEKGKLQGWIYFVALICFSFALLAKTTACTLPIAFVLMELLEGKAITSTRLTQIAPFCAIGVAMGLLSIWWERFHQGARSDLFGVGIPERFLIASKALWFYAAKLVYPANLMFSYPHWDVRRHDLGSYVWPLACIVTILLVYGLRERFGRGLEISGIYYILTLAPLLGFVMESTFRYTFVADHYQYAATIGPCALVAAAVSTFLGRLSMYKAAVYWLVSCGILCFLGYLTFKQSELYRDSETLWRITLRRNPTSALAEYQLACACLENGKVDEGLYYFKDNIGRFPQDADAYYNLGSVFLRLGRFNEAIDNYKKAINIRPDSPRFKNNLGDALLLNGSVDEALDCFEEAVRIEPGFGDAQNNLIYVARLLAMKTDRRFQDEGTKILSRETDDRFFAGNDPEFLHVLGTAYAQAGRTSQALASAQRGRKIALSRSDFLLAKRFENQIQLYERAGVFTNR
jgi:tetratricopeptide (TPR) repeat protein